MIRRQKQAGEQGIALISVLWVVTALALLMSAFNATVRTSATMVDVASLGAQRRAALQSALELAVVELLRARTEGGARGEGQDGAARKRRNEWLRGAHAETIAVAGFVFLVRVQDQNGLVNLNLAERPFLADIIALALPNRLAAEDMARRIVEWRAEGNDGSGAAPISANASSRANSSQQRQFVHTSQLVRQFAMPVEVYARIAPYLTVYSGASLPDMTTAPDVVRRAISAGRTPIAAASANAGASAETAPVGDGPRAYSLTIELAGTTNSPTIGLRSTILLGADKTAPYRVLDWELHNG